MAHQLSNGILTVELADVGSYSGTRFDWTGFITQVTLAAGTAKHTFCVPESLQPGQGTGGIGLCGEYGISRAIGYEEAEVGEWFPKLGVGLLQKQNAEPYLFHHEFPLIPFEKHVQAAEGRITYTVEPLDCRGYSMRLNKTVSLHGDILEIAYELENTGTKPIDTEEYIHNFVGINGAKVGAGYELSWSGTPRVDEPESEYTVGLLDISGGIVRWNREPDRPFYGKPAGWEQAEAEWYWELRHLPSGAGVRESGDFRAARIALWGERHVISPEVFVNINVLPRHSKHWRRFYRFFAL
ncbi:hypothetical protein [Paenibacillus sp. NFR01]|uniref:hypothetical protein n=1 Tax=Paenibacillus sp. NFR01 TaxID=1566279 RepID=UPI0008C48309|nr:hypothetical protein [Paenibacillus sp. NFR01]SES89552.1 hypothetical protein SAMN03159358_0230 [Paenibacillus sp. NFR01]